MDSISSFLVCREILLVIVSQMFSRVYKKTVNGAWLSVSITWNILAVESIHPIIHTDSDLIL